MNQSRAFALREAMTVLPLWIANTIAAFVLDAVLWLFKTRSGPGWV